jgi:hypothetical protein
LLMEHDSGEWRPWLRFDPAALVDELSHTHRDYGVNGGFSKRKGLSASPARVLGGGREGGREGAEGQAILLPWPTVHGPRSTVHLDLNLWGKRRWRLRRSKPCAPCAVSGRKWAKSMNHP